MFTFILPDGTSYRFFRLHADVVNGGGPFGIVELRLLVGDVAYPTVNMIADTAPSPLAASVSGESGSGRNLGAYGAFDGDLTYCWVGTAAPAWISLDLGAGNGIRPHGLRLTPEGTRWPTTFRVMASNTGIFSGEERILFGATGLTDGWTAEAPRTLLF